MQPPTQAPPETHSSGFFPRTQWDLIEAARSENSEDYAGAINALCSNYQRPIIAWFIRAGNSPEDAEDITQKFLARFFTSRKLGNYKKTTFKFRSFLSAALKNFAIDHSRRRKNPVESALSTDDEEAPLDLPDPGEEMDIDLDRSVAIEAYEKAFQRVVDSHLTKDPDEDAKTRAIYSALKPTILGAQEEKYAVIAPRLGISLSALKKIASELQKDWAVQFKQVVAQFSSPADVADEIRSLTGLLFKKKL